MDADAEHRVVEFLSLFDGTPPDMAAIAAAFTADAALYNPMNHAQPVRGREAIAKVLGDQVARYRSSHFKVLSMASKAGQVFTERADIVTLKDGRRIEAFICGVFDLDAQGRIRSWREYWDPADARAQLAQK